MKKSTFKAIALIGLGMVTGLSSCKDDEEDVITPTTPPTTTSKFTDSEVDKLGTVDLGTFTQPTTYDILGVFAPASYSGQSRRVAQLQEIADSSRNEPIVWDIREAMVNAGLDKFASTDAQGNSNLRTKIDELEFDNGNTSVADRFAEMADSLVMSSQANYTVAALNGTAGMITTGSKKRHVSVNGLEYAQLIEKGLYGALLYDQMVDDYLRPVQAGAQNPKGNNETAAGSDYASNGTGRQHAFDEAFGYLAADPATYPNTSNTSNGDGKFIANYLFDFSDEVETAFGVNPAQKLMDAFIFGRSVLKVGQGFGPTNETTNETYYNAAVADIKLYTEIGLATASYNYLNDAISDVTDADKLHHLSEALGFIYALSFNGEGRLSPSEAHGVLKALGWSATDASLGGIYSINLWDVTDAQMEEAKRLLDNAYPGFGALSL
tara:strand:+ start:80697 stop:82007 length:1311 start_codon:yes stop_codon:yes gene_type:complete